MFNIEFFLKHQRLLLLFANTFIGRWILCINGKKSSVGKNKIIKIEPNNITWLVKKGKRKVTLSTEFRTHNKFSKRLYYAFKPFWHLIHFWDILFANNFQPNWNLGFDTLTVYPDPDPESTSFDGYTMRSAVDETWATIRAGAGTGGSDTAANDAVSLVEATTTSGQYSVLRRAFFLFDTSSLPDTSVISAASLYFYPTSKVSGLGDSTDDVVGVAVTASNTGRTNSDYENNVNVTTLWSDTRPSIANLTLNAYTEWALNSAGKTGISLTSITKFCVRIGFDTDNSAPTWASAAQTGGNFDFADQTGTTSDPKLVITYTVPAAGGMLMFL